MLSARRCPVPLGWRLRQAPPARRRLSRTSTWSLRSELAAAPYIAPRGSLGSGVLAAPRRRRGAPPRDYNSRRAPRRAPNRGAGRDGATPGTTPGVLPAPRARRDGALPAVGSRRWPRLPQVCVSKTCGRPKFGGSKLYFVGGGGGRRGEPQHRAGGGRQVGQLS